MKRVGYWQPIDLADELADLDPVRDRAEIADIKAMPRPAEHVRPWSPNERAAVLAYLESGRVHARYKGTSTCRICGKRNGSGEQTDGVYYWPDGLAHYIRDHRVKPPWPEFIEHALRSEGARLATPRRRSKT